MFQAGDATAFEEIYARWRAPLYSFVLRQVALPDRAADIMQETFLRVVRGAGGFAGRSRFSTWLFTVARNLCCDQARRQKHRRHESLDTSARDSQPPLVSTLPSGEPDPEATVTGERVEHDVQAALAALPDEQREVFLLREIEGRSFEEIAAVVGAPLGTVKSRMRYALEGLRRALAAHLRPEEVRP